jgi:arylsulfatase
VPTLLQVAGGKRPRKWQGTTVPPAPGKSLMPLFAQGGALGHSSLWWLHEDNRALRVGDWKIVAAGKESPWELYDLHSDRSETRNQAQEKPEKVRAMATAWTKQFEAYCALATKDLPPEPQSDPCE